MLKYTLRESHLRDKKMFMAQVTDVRSHSEEEIIQMMVKRGSTATAADISAVLQLYNEVISDITVQGDTFNTKTFKSRLSVSGTFESIEAPFDPNKNSITMHIYPSTELQKKLTQVKHEKVSALNTDPYIRQVLDTETELIDSVITKGEYFELLGSHLKFDESDPKQGVFLVIEDVTSVRCEKMKDSKQGFVRARVPKDIESG
ncbi:MAG: DNA-binding domain-containing protein, partial [Treponemataceae bacterium]